MAGHCKQDQDQEHDDERFHSSLNPLSQKDVMTGLTLSLYERNVPRSRARKLS